MLFDDNDYYDHIFGPEDNNNDFNFNFDDFISNEPINDNIDTTPDDITPEIDSISPNHLPPSIFASFKIYRISFSLKS